MITNKQLLNEIKEIGERLLGVTLSNGRILDGWEKSLQNNTDLIEFCQNAQKETRKEVARKIIADMREQIKGYENIDIILDQIEKKYTEGRNDRT